MCTCDPGSRRIYRGLDERPTRTRAGMTTSLRERAYHHVAMSADPSSQNSRDALLLFGRVLLALIFVQSGFGKLLDIGGFSASLAGKGVPAASFFATIGAGVECFGGLAVLLGWQTRYAAA